MGNRSKLRQIKKQNGNIKLHRKKRKNHKTRFLLQHIHIQPINDTQKTLRKKK